jgi:hypothetical protein
MNTGTGMKTKQFIFIMSETETNAFSSRSYPLPHMASGSLMSLTVAGHKNHNVGILNSPLVEITFSHTSPRNSTTAPPNCARWDDDSDVWTGEGCIVALSNSSHTLCKCAVYSIYALVERSAGGLNGAIGVLGGDGRDGLGEDWLTVMLVVVGSIVFVGIVLLLVVVVVCCRGRKVFIIFDAKVRLYGSLIFPFLLQQSTMHRPLKDSPSNFGNLANSSVCCCGFLGDDRNSDPNASFDQSSSKMGSSSHELTLASPDDSSPTFYHHQQHQQRGYGLNEGSGGGTTRRVMQPHQPTLMMAARTMGHNRASTARKEEMVT